MGTLDAHRWAWHRSIGICAGVAIGSTTVQRSERSVEGTGSKRFAAVAFDYFVLFNPDSVVSAVEQVSPVEAYLHLTPWPDTAGALRRLQESDVRVITIANFSPKMLLANAERAGLTTLFDALVSTDANQTYKPDPRAYQLGVDRLHVAKDDIVFAAFGGWDAAGAKTFGYPTVWVNRFNQPLEALGLRPDRTVTDLNGLLDFVLNAACSGARPVKSRREYRGGPQQHLTHRLGDLCR